MQLVLYLSCIIEICCPEEGATGHKSVPERLRRSQEIKKEIFETSGKVTSLFQIKLQYKRSIIFFKSTLIIAFY